MRFVTALAALLALQACSTAAGANGAGAFPTRTADGRLILQSVPASVIPTGEVEFLKAEAYCAKEGKIPRITAIATNVQSANGPQNQVYFECRLASEADKPNAPN